MNARHARPRAVASAFDGMTSSSLPSQVAQKADSEPILSRRALFRTLCSL